MKRSLTIATLAALVALPALAGPGSTGITGKSDYQEDTAHTTADWLSIVGAVRDDGGGPLCGTDNDYCPLSVDATGNLYVTVGVGAGAAVPGFAEDAVHTTGDVGGMCLAVRNDTLAALAGTDGDYSPLQVGATGGLFVTGDLAEDSVHADGASGFFTMAVRNDVLAALAGTDGDYAPFRVDSVGGLYLAGNGIEDAAETAGGNLVMVGTVRRDAAASSAGLTGDNATLNTDATGNLWAILSANSGVDIGDVTINGPLGGGVEAGAVLVTVASDSTGVLSVDDNGGNLSTDWAGVAPPIGAGVEATALRVTLATDSTGVVSVDDNAGNLSVDFNGTNPAFGGGVEAGALLVTMASDSTGVLSVDDNGGNISVDLGGTAATLNSGVVDGGTQRVVLATDVALPAGTNAIGKLAANSGVDIGDVDVTSIAAGTNNIGDVDVEIIGAPATVGTEDAAVGADFDMITAAANTRLMSISCYETAGAAATLAFRHENIATTCDTGLVVAYMRLVANTSEQITFNSRGVDVSSGLCADVIAGTVSCTTTSIVEAAP